MSSPVSRPRPRSRSSSPKTTGWRSRRPRDRDNLSWSRVASMLPLLFVYGLSSWAAWVQARLGPGSGPIRWLGTGSASTGIVLYLLLCACYSAAVFTNPGSTAPSDRSGYLPISEAELGLGSQTTSLTVKSTGSTRFCKKCELPKPDRAHHCSSCQRCVLKMDHHCPWLATCVGLRNYKHFLLFLAYTTLFCILCSAVSSTWIWDSDQPTAESAMAIHAIFLVVISTLFAIVLGGFTGWHLYLATSGKTTIESLEKTRYLAPFREYINSHHHGQHHHGHHRLARSESGSRPGAMDSIQQSLDNLKDRFIEMHVNSIPGVTRLEEGEEGNTPLLGPDPASSFSADIDISAALATSPTRFDSDLSPFDQAERRREAERYLAYLDERETSKLPNAFDVGWKQNLQLVFGRNPFLWLIPLGRPSVDGWRWPINPVWQAERNRVLKKRAVETEQMMRSHRAPAAVPAVVPAVAEPARQPPTSRLSSKPVGLRTQSKSPVPVADIVSTESWNDVPTALLGRPSSTGPGGNARSAPRARASVAISNSVPETAVAARRDGNKSTGQVAKQQRAPVETSSSNAVADPPLKRSVASTDSSLDSRTPPLSTPVAVPTVAPTTISAGDTTDADSEPLVPTGSADSSRSPSVARSPHFPILFRHSPPTNIPTVGLGVNQMLKNSRYSSPGSILSSLHRQPSSSSRSSRSGVSSTIKPVGAVDSERDVGKSNGDGVENKSGAKIHN